LAKAQTPRHEIQADVIDMFFLRSVDDGALSREASPGLQGDIRGGLS
jgi:hypothetical protein